jgi:hypothetical protein
MYPVAHLTRIRWLPDSPLVSLWCLVRRVPGSCLTARSFNRVPGGYLTARSYPFRQSFDVCPVAARRLARITWVYRSRRTWRLPNGSLVSLRGIIRCIPDGWLTAFCRFDGSYDAFPVAIQWLTRIPSMNRSLCARLVSRRALRLVLLLRRVERRVPSSYPKARSYPFYASLAVYLFGFTVCWAARSSRFGRSYDACHVAAEQLPVASSDHTMRTQWLP